MGIDGLSHVWNVWLLVPVPKSSLQFPDRVVLLLVYQIQTTTSPPLTILRPTDYNVFRWQGEGLPLSGGSFSTLRYFTYSTLTSAVRRDYTQYSPNFWGSLWRKVQMYLSDSKKAIKRYNGFFSPVDGIIVEIQHRILVLQKQHCRNWRPSPEWQTKKP